MLYLTATEILTFVKAIHWKCPIFPLISQTANFILLNVAPSRKVVWLQRSGLLRKWSPLITLYVNPLRTQWPIILIQLCSMLSHITNPTPGPIWHMRAKSDHSIRLKNMYFIAAIVVLFVVIVIIIVGKKNFPIVPSFELLNAMGNLGRSWPINCRKKYTSKARHHFVLRRRLRPCFWENAILCLVAI